MTMKQASHAAQLERNGRDANKAREVLSLLHGVAEHARSPSDNLAGVAGQVPSESPRLIVPHPRTELTKKWKAPANGEVDGRTGVCVAYVCPRNRLGEAWGSASTVLRLRLRVKAGPG